jgi:hypothetical protein
LGGRGFEMEAATPGPDPAGRGEPPAQGRSRASLKRLRRCALLAGVGSGLSIALLWGQNRLGVLHPSPALLVLSLVVSFASATCGVVDALWRIVRGPGRRGAAAWGLACLLPIGLWAGLAACALHRARAGDFPKDVLTDVIRMAAASLMEGQARWAYPHRMESARLVMFYDDQVTDPRRDLEAMERHVARLEVMTGTPLRAKIHWVRGGLLGQQRMAVGGLALGRSSSPADWETADHPDRLSVDRHELAHAVLHQLQRPDAAPPALLVEGWADRRAQWAKQSRDLWRRRTGAGPASSYLRELTGDARYSRTDGPA